MSLFPFISNNVDEVKVNIKSDYKIVSSNADYIKNNIR